LPNECVFLVGLTVWPNVEHKTIIIVSVTYMCERSQALLSVQQITIEVVK